MADRRDGSRGTRHVRRTQRTRRTGPRLAVDMDRVVIVRREGDATSLIHTPRLIDWEVAKAVEVFCTGYDGDDLLHDVELAFPTLSFAVSSSASAAGRRPRP